MLSANQPLFDDVRAAAFVIVAGPEVTGVRDLRGLRWVLDVDGAVTARFKADAPHWLLLDPTLRVMESAPAESDAVLRRLENLPPPADHAGVPLHAPVLFAPRILEPELCQALIDLHQASGGEFTGVMRDEGARTVAVMDDLKKRRDVLVTNPELVAAITERLERRLSPMIVLALGFKLTRIERFLVSCYDEGDGGVFRPHRDNTTQGTAYRMFACSLNLNDDCDGGDLRFAEFGGATYRPPLGGAVVFSCSLMHEVLPVRRGRRYALLPFFYDETGAARLAEYQARQAQTEVAS